MNIEETINIINLLQNKYDYNDTKIAKYLDITTKELRELRLNNNIQYKDEKYKDYLNLALEMQNLVHRAYFPVELARMTGRSKSTVNMVCKMFNIRPSKKAYCLCCGKELQVKLTAVPSYCNSTCRYKHKGVDKC